MKTVIVLICALALAGCATFPTNKKQDQLYPKNRNVAQKIVRMDAPVVRVNVSTKPKPKPKPKHWWQKSSAS